MILKALLSKSTVNEVFLYPLELNQLSIVLIFLCCLLTYHRRESSIILLQEIGRLREYTWLFKTTENKGIFKTPVCF